MIRWGLIFLSVAFMAALLGYGALLLALKNKGG